MKSISFLFYLWWAFYIDPMSLFLNNPPITLLLNSQIISMHLDSKKSMLTPVSTPTISNDPKFNTILAPPANYRNFVVREWKQLGFRVNSFSIFLEFLCDIDWAGNGTSSKYLSFHFINSSYQTVLGYFPDWISWCCPAVSRISWLITFGRSAVLAFLNVRTSKSAGVFRLIVLAWLFRDAISFCILINKRRHSTVAASSCLAVDDNLWR